MVVSGTSRCRSSRNRACSGERAGHSHEHAQNGIVAAVFDVPCGGATNLRAQDKDEAPAITARVHGTFVDRRRRGRIQRRHVRRAVRGPERDGDGHRPDHGCPRGQRRQRARARGRGARAAGREYRCDCNQLRMELAAADAEVLSTRVHFDSQTAGFDSREARRPRRCGCCARWPTSCADHQPPPLARTH